MIRPDSKSDPTMVGLRPKSSAIVTVNTTAISGSNLAEFQSEFDRGRTEIWVWLYRGRIPTELLSEFDLIATATPVAFTISFDFSWISIEIRPRSNRVDACWV